MPHVLDALARRLFVSALAEDCAGELLQHLFDGDGVTIDPTTRQIVYLPASEIARLAADA